MALRTYGDKPISFQIEEGGEFYCVGSEVMTRFKIWLCASCAVKFMMDLRSRSVITCGCSVGRSTRSTLAWSGGPWPTKKGNVWSTMAWARTFYLALYRYSKRPKLRILSRAMMTSEYSFTYVVSLEHTQLVSWFPVAITVYFVGIRQYLWAKSWPLQERAKARSHITQHGYLSCPTLHIWMLFHKQHQLVGLESIIKR